MEKKPISLKYDTEKLIGVLERNLIETTNAVFIGLEAVDKIEEKSGNLQGNNPFRFYGPFLKSLNLEQSQNLFRRWVIKKGTEDLIKGISMMLSEVCRLIKTYEEISTNNPMSNEKLYEIINKPYNQIYKMHLPELLNTIKPYLTTSLKYETEILSLNRVRRCLVHRDGYVSELDADKTSKKLTLEWVYFKLHHTDKEGNKTEFNKPRMINSDSILTADETRKTKDFSLGSHVDIEFDEFNDIVFTCFRFGNYLISKMKLTNP